MTPPLDPMTAPTVIALASVARDVRNTWLRALSRLQLEDCLHENVIEESYHETPNGYGISRVCMDCGYYHSCGDEMVDECAISSTRGFIAGEVTPDEFKRSLKRLYKIGLLSYGDFAS